MSKRVIVQTAALAALAMPAACSQPEELPHIVVGRLPPSFTAEAPQYLDDRAISMDPADYEPATWAAL